MAEPLLQSGDRRKVDMEPEFVAPCQEGLPPESIRPLDHHSRRSWQPQGHRRPRRRRALRLVPRQEPGEHVGEEAWEGKV